MFSLSLSMHLHVSEYLSFVYARPYLAHEHTEFHCLYALIYKKKMKCLSQFGLICFHSVVVAGGLSSLLNHSKHVCNKVNC